ncbi:hypothetical protein RIF29_11273 [Crotalaria pallida]|uniref:Membrane protein of ER body-like protein n=1 Tax=Crotalaria pallida TaxID=3830 RepID=A0AAN9ILZ8_CROPI
MEQVRVQSQWFPVPPPVDEEEEEIQDTSALEGRKTLQLKKDTTILTGVTPSSDSPSSPVSNGHSNGVSMASVEEEHLILKEEEGEKEAHVAEKEEENVEDIIGNVENGNHVNDDEHEAVGLGLVAEFVGDATSEEVLHCTTTTTTVDVAASHNNNSVYFDKQQGNEVNGLEGVQNGDGARSALLNGHGEGKFEIQAQNGLCDEVNQSHKVPYNSDLSPLHDSSGVQAENFGIGSTAKAIPNLIEEIDQQLEDYNVEAVLEKQETHELYCPNCNACITKRVIKKRKRIPKQENEAKPDTPHTESVQSFAPDANEGGQEIETSGAGNQGGQTTPTPGVGSLVPPADNDDPESGPEVFRCPTCLSIFIALRNGLFPCFRDASEPDISQPLIPPSNLENPSNIVAPHANWFISLITKKWKRASGQGETSIENPGAGPVEQHHSSSTTPDTQTSLGNGHPAGPVADSAISETFVENPGAGPVEQHHSSSTTPDTQTSLGNGHPAGPVADSAISETFVENPEAGPVEQHHSSSTTPDTQTSLGNGHPAGPVADSAISETSIENPGAGPVEQHHSSSTTPDTQTSLGNGHPAGPVVDSAISETSVENPGAGPVEQHHSSSTTPDTQTSLGNGHPAGPVADSAISETSVENPRAGPVEQHRSSSTTTNTQISLGNGHPAGPVADTAISNNVEPEPDTKPKHGEGSSPVPSSVKLKVIEAGTENGIKSSIASENEPLTDQQNLNSTIHNNLSSIQSSAQNSSNAKVGEDVTDSSAKEHLPAGNVKNDVGEKQNDSTNVIKTDIDVDMPSRSFPGDAVSNSDSLPSATPATTESSIILEGPPKNVDKTPGIPQNGYSSLVQDAQPSAQTLGIAVVATGTGALISSTPQTADNAPVQSVIGTGSHTQIYIGRQPRPDMGEPLKWEIVKSIVYGGLVESITSLGIVSSAAGSGAAPLNIVAMGLANLISGLFIIFHNLIELRNDQPRGVPQQTGLGDPQQTGLGDPQQINMQDRYQEQLGRRENFLLHIVVAILSFLIFGAIPILVYGLLINKNYYPEVKLAAVAVTSVVCIILLAIGEVYTKRPTKSYTTTLLQYVTLAIAASGVSYIAGGLLDHLLQKFNGPKSGFVLTMPSSGSKRGEPAWLSY